MCKLCDAGFRQNHFDSRRNFLKGAAATGIAAAGGLKLFAPRPAAAEPVVCPNGTGMPGRRYVIRGGAVMSMDPRKSADFAEGRCPRRGQEDPRQSGRI